MVPSILQQLKETDAEKSDFEDQKGNNLLSLRWKAGLTEVEHSQERSILDENQSDIVHSRITKSASSSDLCSHCVTPALRHSKG